MPLNFKIGKIFSDAQGMEYTVVDLQLTVWSEQADVPITNIVTFQFLGNQSMTVSFPAVSSDFNHWYEIRK